MKSLKINLKLLENQAKKELKEAQNLAALEEVSKKYLGKKGKLPEVLRSLKNLSEKEKRERGKLANQIKKELEKAVDFKKNKIQNTCLTGRQARYPEEKPSASYGAGKTQDDWLDISLPGKKPVLGHLHPLTLVRKRVEEIFQMMGFSVVEGPEIENEWYNFDALNIPKDHPARDVWDTFYLKGGSLLRTHTSPNQVRYLEKHQLPLRIIVPGNVYRHEATDLRHEFQLFQVEGLMVDKEISVASFKAIIGEFFRRFFKKDIKFRIEPDFFPFTEPSFNVNMSCLVCQGRGCSACKRTGWMEVAGAGMVHPNVFKNAGLNPKEWRGWAFGFGLDRLVMMKYKINDIRLLRSGDLRFLNQF